MDNQVNMPLPGTKGGKLLAMFHNEQAIYEIMRDSSKVQRDIIKAAEKIKNER